MPQDTDTIPIPLAPSHGRQRTGTDAKGKGKAMPSGKGRRKRDPSKSSPEGADSSWKQTKSRFDWELLEEYYLRPAGKSIKPEEAFAAIHKFIKEDLHRSVSNLFLPRLRPSFNEFANAATATRSSGCRSKSRQEGVQVLRTVPDSNPQGAPANGDRRRAGRGAHVHRE